MLFIAILLHHLAGLSYLDVAVVSFS